MNKLSLILLIVFISTNSIAQDYSKIFSKSDTKKLERLVDKIIVKEYIESVETTKDGKTIFGKKLTYTLQKPETGAVWEKYKKYDDKWKKYYTKYSKELTAIGLTYYDPFLKSFVKYHLKNRLLNKFPDAKITNLYYTFSGSGTANFTFIESRVAPQKGIEQKESLFFSNRDYNKLSKLLEKSIVRVEDKFAKFNGIQVHRKNFILNGKIDIHKLYKINRKKLWVPHEIRNSGAGPSIVTDNILKKYLRDKLLRQQPDIKVISSSSYYKNSGHIDYVPNNQLNEYVNNIEEKKSIDKRNKEISKINDKLPFTKNSEYYISNKSKGIYAKTSLKKVKSIPDNMKYVTNFRNGYAQTNMGIVDISQEIVLKTEYDISQMSNKDIDIISKKALNYYIKIFGEPSKILIRPESVEYKYPFYNLNKGTKTLESDLKLNPNTYIIYFENSNKSKFKLLITDNNIKVNKKIVDHYNYTKKVTLINGVGDTGGRYEYKKVNLDLELSNYNKLNIFIRTLSEYFPKLTMYKVKTYIKTVADFHINETIINEINYYDMSSASTTISNHNDDDCGCEIDYDRISKPSTFDFGKIYMANGQHYYYDKKKLGYYHPCGVCNPEYHSTLKDLMEYLVKYCKSNSCQ